MTAPDDDLLALAAACGIVRDTTLIQTTAGNLDPSWLGREVLVGCYPPAVLWFADQLPVLGRTFIYTSDGMLDVPAMAPVTSVGGAR